MKATLLTPKYFAALLCVLVAVPLFLGTTKNGYVVPPTTVLSTSTDITLISHAGGGLSYGAYSNSLEGLERAYADGLRVFEVDVHVTADGHPILLHDWGPGLRKWYRLPVLTWFRSLANDGAPLLEKDEFGTLAMRYNLTSLDLNELAEWMNNKPTTLVNLNIKKDALKVLSNFALSFPELRDRVIVEVYTPSTSDAFIAQGFTKLLWVADDYDDETILANLISHDFYAVTFAANKKTLLRAALLMDSNTPLWIYTINAVENATILENAGVDAIYTDSLIPPKQAEPG